MKQRKRHTKPFCNNYPENLLTKITADNTAIEWEEEGKEFKLNGEMYDVVHTSVENGKTYLHCFSDKNEDEVLQQFQSVVKHTVDNSPNSGKDHHTVKATVHDWVFEVQDISVGRKLLSGTSTKYFNYTPALSNRFVQINYPPPELFS
ncbi:MAG: hypothetical protein WDM90_12875 [Ferruginibacter sp.]